MQGWLINYHSQWPPSGRACEDREKATDETDLEARDGQRLSDIKSLAWRLQLLRTPADKAVLFVRRHAQARDTVQGHQGDSDRRPSTILSGSVSVS